MILFNVLFSVLFSILFTIFRDSLSFCPGFERTKREEAECGVRARIQLNHFVKMVPERFLSKKVRHIVQIFGKVYCMASQVLEALIRSEVVP